MDKILLKPIGTEVQYEGKYAAFAFKLLANPVPFYENLLRVFEKHGASLLGLRYEAGNLSDANISCTLPNLNAEVRVRLDRLSVRFFRLDTVGEKMAHQVVIDAWNVIKTTDMSICVAQHAVTVNSQVELQEASYNALLQRYVVAPAGLRSHTGSAVVFYLGEDLERGEMGGSIVLDRSRIKDGALYIAIAVVFDATKVPVEVVGSHTDGYVTRQLETLGLTLERLER